ncbi:MAG: lipid-binding SYLF domain-containing protein [Acidobacteriaceae bacterium]
MFVQLEGASFGFQIGGQSTDSVLVGMNRHAIDDLLKDKVKQGGDVAVAASPIGRNSQASTTELANAEFLTYSRSRGLFAGIDLNGDIVHQNSADTEIVYGRDIPFARILSAAVNTRPAAVHFVATVNELFRRGVAHERTEHRSSGSFDEPTIAMGLMYWAKLRWPPVLPLSDRGLEGRDTPKSEKGQVASCRFDTQPAVVLDHSDGR